MKSNRCTVQNYAAIVALAVSAVMFLPTACTKDQTEEPEDSIITMTTQAPGVGFYMQKLEAGGITIDWGDGEGSIAIDFEEASDFYYSSISHSYSGASPHNITITGNISYLDCRSNELTKLDVSRNTKLSTLWCGDNQLTELDVSGVTALKVLNCCSNSLTQLDVSRNMALAGLDCYYNQLTSLDVSRNTALFWLDCNNNQLTTLDVSRNTELTDLRCYDNQLTKLDVRNTALTRLYCQYNQLTTSALNNLFRALPENLPLTKKSPDPWYHIYIYGNPGSSDCNVSIAEEKWWKVVTE